MAISGFRALLWWSKWSKKDWAIAVICFVFIVFVFSFLSDSWHAEDSVVNHNFDLNPADDPDLVDLSLLHNAKAKGALCLDGSLPGYHFQKGFGSGSSNWVLHIEGGGWCHTVSSCSSRKMTPLGSSDYMERRVRFSGILSSDASQNPDFYNWNKIKIRYCDGASLAGHPAGETNVQHIQNGNILYFRGQLIWEALMDELLSVGLSKARQALLSGCSAGGLATLIHCDDFRELLPKDATIKCLADAGFFLDEKDVSGNHTMRSFYHDVFNLQKTGKSLPKDCTATDEPSKCFFPQEVIKHISTPLFLVNPAYDFWQIQNVLVPNALDPAGSWQKCRLNIFKCDHAQLEILQGFRDSLLKAVNDFKHNKEGGLFVNSCFIHCQTWMSETWHSPNSPRINKRTIAEAVGDWYFKRNSVKLIDCPFPCNPTCIHMDFSRG
ncbi:pectin acetylesterase 5-like isoform X2 [Benincasa hispida]|uniref:pectin acetylesterase 5-like isoform X2 n=1 Tax=Benincasa hispida TaxID=102211 RepID=UPI001902BB61|nr:pectin acetylesterase 5-like isoform X2 [Benincasa hispida]